MRPTALGFASVGLVVYLVVTSGVAAAAHSNPEPGSPGPDVSAGSAADPAGDRCGSLANGSDRPDPETDELGWERGCWHDETIRIDHSDGLNATELEAVVARTIARVEVVRRLEFEGEVPLEIISREEFARRIENRFGATGSDRLRTNVLWEALMMVGEDAEAVDALRSNMGGSRGYYSPTDGRIVLVSDDPESPRLNEPLLAHELVHVFQDQHFDVADRFDLSTFERHRTIDSQNAINSLIEGDAVFVQILYLRRCGDEWDCLTASAGDSSADIHRGLSYTTNYPYLDGRKLIHDVRAEDDWTPVNQLYDDPPASTGQVIDSGSYPGEEPPTVEFTDTSGDRWRIPEGKTGQPEYESVGMPGLTSMFVYTVYDTNRQQPAVVPLRAFNNNTGNGLYVFDPYQYENNPYASGLEGDRLYPYVTDASAETGETGYVWKLEFETANDSEQFVNGYTELLTYYNASPVEDRANTYRIPDQDRFGDAHFVNHTGSTVVVVNAPGVEELSAIRASAAPTTEGPTLPDGPTGWLLAAGVLVLVVVVAIRGRNVLDRGG